MRRSLLLVAAVVPFAVIAAAHGCSSQQPFDSACRWMEDPENCFREFHEDMLAAKGPDNLNGDCRTYPPLPVSAYPTQASQAAPGVSNGRFMNRAMLDTCFLMRGGQVTVTPPIDLTMFPPSPYADPVQYTFSLVNYDGNECGNIAYTSPHGFSLTIDPPPDAGTTAMTDAGIDASMTPADGGPEMDDAGPPIPFGTYTQYNAPGRDSLDVTCPSGNSFHFTLDEIDITNPDAGACPQYASILPSASLQIYLGGTDTPGALSLAINFPPPSPTSGSEAYPPGPLEPQTVVYFNCQIPAAMETCVDGVKDGEETFQDCGGPQQPSMMYCGQCPPRCAVMQNCICDGDCMPGLNCGVDPMTGMRVCGATGIHFPVCSYTDPPLNCPDAGPGDAGGTGGGGTGGGGTGGGPTDGGQDSGSDAGPSDAPSDVSADG
jgi:hypothetical protein